MPAVIRRGKLIATCDVCGRVAHHGFGPFWACIAHFKEVEILWQSKGSPVK